jgi:hypothetical protein
MAYVAISNSLENDVANRIRAMYQKELSTLGAEPDITLRGDEDWLLEQVWGNYLHLKDVLPAEWKLAHSTMVLNVQHVPDPLAPSKKLYFSAVVGVHNPLACPPRGPQRYSIKAEANASPEIAAFYEYCLKRQDINNRWDTVRTQVMTFLRNCKSLNEGLKLWPDLRHYIPQPYLERIEEKRGKAEKNTAAIDALKQIDTDALQAAVVISRMS